VRLNTLPPLGGGLTMPVGPVDEIPAPPVPPAAGPVDPVAPVGPSGVFDGFAGRLAASTVAPGENAAISAPANRISRLSACAPFVSSPALRRRTAAA
jgi:hypothetical protein